MSQRELREAKRSARLHGKRHSMQNYRFSTKQQNIFLIFLPKKCVQGLPTLHGRVADASDGDQGCNELCKSHYRISIILTILITNEYYSETIIAQPVLARLFL